jgi:hypothetical protein
VCVCVRERESVCVCERECMSVCVWARLCLRIESERRIEKARLPLTTFSVWPNSVNSLLVVCRSANKTGTSVCPPANHQCCQHFSRPQNIFHNTRHQIAHSLVRYIIYMTGPLAALPETYRTSASSPSPLSADLWPPAPSPLPPFPSPIRVI